MSDLTDAIDNEKTLQRALVCAWFKEAWERVLKSPLNADFFETFNYYYEPIDPDRLPEILALGVLANSKSFYGLQYFEGLNEVIKNRPER
jgi:hypothetical protein